MSILIVGFSAFPGVARNPSQDVIKALSPRLSEINAAGIVLPVSWDETWPQLKAAIEADRPKTVLMFGAHLRAERFRVELLARNHRELGRRDALGAFPPGPSIGEGPQTINCRLEWSTVAAALRQAAVDFEWSTNAGAYLCNDTLYRLALAANGLGVKQFGFFHLPSSDEGVGDLLATPPQPDVFLSLPLAKMEAAAMALLQMTATTGSEGGQTA